MTSKLILAASLLSLAAALSPAANAAPSGPAGQTVEQAGSQAQRHSHLQEKLGIAPTAPGKAAPKAEAAQPVHDHGKFHK